jgi:SAM-dependent methyltransferase
MTSRLSSNVWKTLTCSYCGLGLRQTATGADCAGCGLHYQYTDAGALDLRLKKVRKYHLEVELGTPLSSDEGLEVEPLKAAARPEVDFGDMAVPVNMTSELMSHFPRAKSENSLMLDLACGHAVHKGIIEHAGFEWVGADYDDSRQASVLADAHALPFADNTFDCILSVAAIHLFRYPLVMMKEAHRVLKPNGRFLGTVAFLEPFHDGGYYHHTHLGAINSLRFGGFKVEKLAPSVQWSGLTAQASMSLFPKMPKFLSSSIVYPVQLLHQAWWQMGSMVTRNPNAEKNVRIRNNTAAFSFVASKGDA